MGFDGGKALKSWDAPVREFRLESKRSYYYHDNSGSEKRKSFYALAWEAISVLMHFWLFQSPIKIHWWGKIVSNYVNVNDCVPILAFLRVRGMIYTNLPYLHILLKRREPFKDQLMASLRPVWGRDKNGKRVRFVDILVFAIYPWPSFSSAFSVAGISPRVSVTHTGFIDVDSTICEIE